MSEEQKEYIECVRNAKNEDDLRTCSFFKRHGAFKKTGEDNFTKEKYEEREKKYKEILEERFPLKYIK